MARRRWPPLTALAPGLAWMVLLAMLPWWLGLPLLLALVAAALLQPQRLAAHAGANRRALRWGLPGVLLALQRALGGDAFAWGAALLGALAGYTLLAALEAWLDRERVRPPPAAETAGWPELAQAPIGPPAEIIELQPPLWQRADEVLVDPLGAGVHYRNGCYVLADGSTMDGAGPHAAFSPAGHWLVARLDHDGGVVLCDRQRRRQHRLRGWQLCGWHGEQPWLSRAEGDMPQLWSAGQDDG
ncbi:MAG: hypothetical protein ABI386_12525 [Rhodanobacter sp.]